MFAYMIGIVTGMMDVLQSSDFDNCKLPTVGGGDIFQCVCGDKALAIPHDKRYVCVFDMLPETVVSASEFQWKGIYLFVAWYVHW